MQYVIADRAGRQFQDAWIQEGDAIRMRQRLRLLKPSHRAQAAQRPAIAEWKDRTRDAIAAFVLGLADFSAPRLSAFRRALRRRIRLLQGEIQHLRATERAVARAFAGLRGDGEPKHNRSEPRHNRRQVGQRRN